MTSYQEDRFGTLLKVDLFNSRNSTALAINTLFALVDGELDTLRADILANDVMAIRDLSGFTEAKANKRKELEEQLFLICNGLRGHYAGTGDVTLARQVNLAKSHLETISEELLNTEAEMVWKYADPIKATLGPNQVTATNVDDLQTIRQDFVGMMKINRAEEGASKRARERLVVIFEKAFNEVLAKLDELMMPFASTNPGLYSEYQTARMIDDSGGGSGSEGYNVTNYTVPAGGSILMPVFGSGSIPADLDVYLRAVNGNLTICTTNLPASPCSSGYALQQGVTYKGLFSTLGLDMNLAAIQFTNSSGNDVIVRAGGKNE